MALDYRHCAKHRLLVARARHALLCTCQWWSHWLLGEGGGFELSNQSHLWQGTADH